MLLTGSLRLLGRWLLALLCALAATSAALAAPQPGQRLCDQEPFDQLTLDAENKNAIVKVEPLDFPNRLVPNEAAPESKLRIKLAGEPDLTYEVQWKHIAKVELFEQMVLAEAQAFVTADRLDDAYDSLQYLRLQFPKTAGLEAALQAYLYHSAGRHFRLQQWLEALAVLEELHRLNPAYRSPNDGKSLVPVIASVLQKIVEQHIGNHDYRAVRLTLTNASARFGAVTDPFVDQWQAKLKTMAEDEKTSVLALAGEGKLHEANRGCRRMLAMWPDLPGGRELAHSIASQFPMILVGVDQPARSLDARRLDDWGARRAGKLVDTPLVEFLRPGAEGGQYAFRHGSLQASEDRQRLTLRLNEPTVVTTSPSPLTGYDLAERLLALARPDDANYSPTWEAIFRGVTVKGVLRADVDLRSPYVLPAALLQIPWPVAPAAFEAMPKEGQDAFFRNRLRAENPAAPAQITERFFETSNQAVAALRRGEIDVIDRIFPGDFKRLSDDSAFVVQRYELPTLHMLLPTPGRAMSGSRTLRRAIAYGIDRQGILSQQLLGNEELRGSQVISGPFSPGVITNDPLAYAADSQIAPRPYDSRLAAALVGLAKREFALEADKTKQASPEVAVVIGHPASHTARVACQAISVQLELIGLTCTLHEFGLGETRDVKNECDFVYAEVVMAEPLVDARRLLSSEGLARLPDPYLNLALRRLDTAPNWPAARERLKEVHRLVHAEISIIPLWQLVEHYARRAEMSGLEGRVVSLYENVQAWQATKDPDVKLGQN